LAVDRGGAEQLKVANSGAGRRRLWAAVRAHAGGDREARVVMVYEASCQGFGLYDEAREEGFECHVLAPTKIPCSPAQRRGKNDARDAARLLELVRGHCLAGNALPAVWVPDAQTRDDREVVRTRLDVAEKLTAVKTQVQTFLKRQRQRRPAGAGKGWTNGFVAWLRGLAAPHSPLAAGARAALASLLRQKAALEAEIAALDEAVAALAGQPRYRAPAAALLGEHGVGLLTAMVVLTELGDLRRFLNRKQIAAFLGLAPTSCESGEHDDCKGHITRQGPWRVRRVLCQCVWARIRSDAGEAAVYERLVARNPKHKKIAVVAGMRRLAILMWHRAKEAQESTGAWAVRAEGAGSATAG
jgi:transposase